MKKKNRIVITGGSGFIGSHLARELRSRGYDNLIILDRNSFNDGKIKSIICDLSDKKLLEKIIKEKDIVIHLACSSIPATSDSLEVEKSVVESLNLLDVCVNKKIKKFIFISSGGAVYGDYGNKSVKESADCNPINFYGAMKLAIEKYIHVFNRLHGLEYVIARVGNPYGRLVVKNSQQGAVDILLRKVMNDEEIEIWGDGSIVRDYIFIDDVVDFLIKSVELDYLTGIFNIGTGKGTSINELTNIIEGVTGKKAYIKNLRSREVDLLYNVLDISRAKKVAKWKPKVELREGIEGVYNNLCH